MTFSQQCFALVNDSLGNDKVIYYTSKILSAETPARVVVLDLAP
jgi:hypothetical protein